MKGLCNGFPYLYFTNIKSKTIINTVTMAKNNIQRALVLQGGGSLGAYEAGVFNTLYYWIKNENDASTENDNILM
jgi:hypothetical protein